MDAEAATQTAMMLTKQEWADLAVMVAHYRRATSWVEYPSREPAAHVADLLRQRALAERIIEAA